MSLPQTSRPFPLFNTLCAGVLLLAAPGGSARAQQPSGGRPNLLSNGSFEEEQAGWQFQSYHSRGTVTLDAAEKHDGKTSICIENPAADDSFLKQTIAVKPKTRYRMSGYIKTRDIVGKAGATLALEGGFEKTEVIAATKGWTKVSFEFDSGALDSIKIGPRLGHYSNPVMGKAWFDDLTLVELGASRKR